METVRLQRESLCDLLQSLNEQQWQAETLCGGWDAGDVVAHMLVREREPWASAGLMIPPLAALHASRMEVRKQAGRERLIRQLRSGPPKLATMGIVGRVQVGEDYIHTEDIRRGAAAAIEGTADLTADDGTGDAGIDELLWQAIGRFALTTLGGVRGRGVLAMTDGGRTRAYRVGGPVPLPARDGRADVTINGTAGELLLYTTGRTAADVHVHGDQTLIDALQASRRGI